MAIGRVQEALDKARTQVETADAIVKAETLALRVIAERLEHGESKRTSIHIALPAAA